ncbi:alpha/beta fold hydrolase [Fibrella aquatilis]|uniref:Alpha/beta hydrolase n=1 Tax=Fibrella aquatilis TaxID=2817059 RepID=A0A939G6E1_9BACT|nr:alpha/beta hydrolase [Fibrella aquatilis]MBO0931037.1 alpha/beta hydrolase [Fibrella aquatilis]
MSTVQYPTSFVKYGSGPVIWLAFHGIGQDAAAMAPLGERLSKTHTVYSIDLPYHGQDNQTNWPANITKTYWQSLVAHFLTKHGIDRFSVVGFSMGGRFALITASLFAPQLDELILIAPDGITEDPWFRLATNTAPGRWLLRFFLNNTRLFTRLGHGLVRLGLLSAGLMRFVEATMQTPEQRAQIGQAWVGFRHLTTDIPALAKQLRANKVHVWLFLGQFDAVLPLGHTRPLLRALPETTEIILPSGHTSLVRRVAAGWPFSCA